MQNEAFFKKFKNRISGLGFIRKALRHIIFSKARGQVGM